MTRFCRFKVKSDFSYDYLKEANFVQHEMLSVTAAHIICHIVMPLSCYTDQQIACLSPPASVLLYCCL